MGKTCLFLLLNSLLCVRETNAGLTDGLQFSKELAGDSIRVFNSISHKDCRVECLARKACKSYNYSRRLLLCELKELDTNSPSAELQLAYGVVYSQKCDWQTQVIHEHCDTCDNNTFCDISNVTDIKCVTRECLESHVEIPFTSVRGSDKSVGAVARYFCDQGYNKIFLQPGTDTSVCQENGRWSNPSIRCVPEICSHMTPPANATFTDIRNQGDKVVADFQCPSPLIPRQNTVECDVNNGIYYSNTSCCDTPDEGNWTMVYRIHSGGQLSVLSFWTNATRQTAASFPDCQFHRLDILSNWTSHGIRRVKLDISVNNSIVQWIIFDGDGVNRIQWFMKNKILSSSWTDIRTDSYDKFSIYGTARKNPAGHTQRLARFLIATTFNLDCTRDAGWLFLVTVDKQCSLRSTSGLRILYAPSHTRTSSGAELNLADKLEISVKFD